MTHATRRRSICRRVSTYSNGGTSSGIKAIWMGRIFCEEIATTNSRLISSHLTLPVLALCWRSTNARILSARAWASPDLAMATANAPSNAYDKATVAPPPKPPLNAFNVPSIPSPPTRPPTNAPMIKAMTTCTRDRLSSNMMPTAAITEFILCNLLKLLAQNTGQVVATTATRN
ncbi:hypothetical protein D3C80_1064480 [compost metagenome]